jgi:hypothetical protein
MLMTTDNLSPAPNKPHPTNNTQQTDKVRLETTGTIHQKEGRVDDPSKDEEGKLPKEEKAFLKPIGVINDKEEYILSSDSDSD